ncbi:CopD family protein, partial [Aliarcobacter butzleri]
MLAINPSLLQFGWMYAKITAIIILIIYSLSIAKYRKQLADDCCTNDGKVIRMYNEMPTMLAILIDTYVI